MAAGFIQELMPHKGMIWWLPVLDHDLEIMVAGNLYKKGKVSCQIGNLLLVRK
jgi:hypothetical protein